MWRRRRGTHSPYCMLSQVLNCCTCMNSTGCTGHRYAPNSHEKEMRGFSTEWHRSACRCTPTNSPTGTGHGAREEWQEPNWVVAALAHLTLRPSFLLSTALQPIRPAATGAALTGALRRAVLRCALLHCAVLLCTALSCEGPACCCLSKPAHNSTYQLLG